MKSADYIYVESAGTVYRMTAMRYRRMLINASQGQEVNFSEYGKRIGSNLIDLSDLDEDMARSRLSDIEWRLSQ